MWPSAFKLSHSASTAINVNCVVKLQPNSISQTLAAPSIQLRSTNKWVRIACAHSSWTHPSNDRHAPRTFMIVDRPKFMVELKFDYFPPKISNAARRWCDAPYAFQMRSFRSSTMSSVCSWNLSHVWLFYVCLPLRRAHKCISRLNLGTKYGERAHTPSLSSLITDSLVNMRHPQLENRLTNSLSCLLPTICIVASLLPLCVPSNRTT